MALRIDIGTVPLDIRRMVAQHLEEVRDSDIGVGIDQAYLGQEVCPMYRLDKDGIAYYEFEIVGTERPRRVIATSAMRSPTFGTGTGVVGLEQPARGFILASSGKHDFPIPHFSFEHPPVSVQLEEEARLAGKTIAKIYKLDVFSYVAEDSQGNKVAQVGTLPLIPKSIPSNPERFREDIRQIIVQASAPSDDRIPKRAPTAKKSGPSIPKLNLLRKASWPLVKADYKARFAFQLSELERRAQQAWEIHDLVRAFGEGVQVGKSLKIGLLRKAASAEITGDAADIVKLKLIDRGEGPQSLELRVDEFPFSRETPFQIHIRYDDGTKEDLDFFAVSPQIPSNVRKFTVDG